MDDDVLNLDKNQAIEARFPPKCRHHMTERLP